MCKGIRIKEFRVVGNLNGTDTVIIMTNLTSQIEILTKIIYSFKSEIHGGAGESVDYTKILTVPPDMFTSFEEIQAFIEECGQKRLHLKNTEVWLKAYLPARQTTKTQGIYQAKLSLV